VDRMCGRLATAAAGRPAALLFGPGARLLPLRGAYACRASRVLLAYAALTYIPAAFADPRRGELVAELSELAEIVATLVVAVIVIWLPGAIVIRAADRMQVRRQGRGRD
jgi:hypothetical protein